MSSSRKNGSSRREKERQARQSEPPTPETVDDARADGGTCCYCNGDRNLGQLELYCGSCNNWFHGHCLVQLKNFHALPFMVCYNFLCTDCNSPDGETWVPRQANFAHMCVTALANLTWLRGRRAVTHEADRLFSLQTEIVPFFTQNWENLTSMPRRVKSTWHQTLQRTMLKETDLFVSRQSDGDSDDMFFGLVEGDLAKIGPHHEVVRGVGRKQATSVSGVVTAEGVSLEPPEPPKTRGARRKAESQATNGAKKAKTTNDYTSTRFSGFSYPVDHPFNRDGYRYFLVEHDTHAPNRREFDLLDEAKPIPAYFYRLVSPAAVELSSHDRAPQLRLAEDHLTVTGDRGYAVVRGSHGVTQGAWFFELTVVEQPANSHCRVGWSQSLGCLQAPVGYDRFSYCWRSRKGTRFHDSRGLRYSDGYGAGDVLGCLIQLPSVAAQPVALPHCHKNLPLIKFKSHFYYEEKDEAQKALKSLKPLPGSQISFYRNGVDQGVAFSDVNGGTYFPAISLYKGATVRANFGPRFRFPPKNVHFKPLCERARDLLVERCLSDVLYYVENEGKLTLD